MKIKINNNIFSIRLVEETWDEEAITKNCDEWSSESVKSPVDCMDRPISFLKRKNNIEGCEDHKVNNTNYLIEKRVDKPSNGGAMEISEGEKNAEIEEQIQSPTIKPLSANQGLNFQHKKRNRRNKKGTNLKKFQKKITKEKQMVDWKNFTIDLVSTGEEEEEEEENEIEEVEEEGSEDGKHIYSDKDYMTSLFRKLKFNKPLQAMEVRKIGVAIGINWDGNDKDGVKRFSEFLEKLRGSRSCSYEDLIS